jgi:hypothetical protein
MAKLSMNLRFFGRKWSQLGFAQWTVARIQRANQIECHLDGANRYVLVYLSPSIAMIASYFVARAVQPRELNPTSSKTAESV